MQQYILFLCVDELREKAIFDHFLLSVLNNEIADRDIGCPAERVSSLHAACVHPYSSDMADSKSVPLNRQLVWTLIKDQPVCDAFVNDVKCNSQFNKSMIDCCGDELHTLAARLPPLGVVTDIIWIVQNIKDFNCDISIYGGLKRFCRWHNATVTILHCQDDAVIASPVFTLWANSVHAVVEPFDSKITLSLWHGSVTIAASQQTVKLPGFHLRRLPTCFTGSNNDVEFGIKLRNEFKEEKIFYSTGMKFLAEINYSEVPTFYLTSDCYELNILSHTDSVDCSRQFLSRLTSTSNKCYILRLFFGTNCSLVKSVAGPCENAKSWQELIKENIAHASDNPCYSELDGQLGFVNFLIRPVTFSGDPCSVLNVSSNTCIFVAIRMRDVSEINGAVAHTLARSISMEVSIQEKIKNFQSSIPSKRLVHDQCPFPAKALFHCLKQPVSKKDSSCDIPHEENVTDPGMNGSTKLHGVIHQPQSECLQDFNMQPERLMLSFRTAVDSVDKVLQLAKDTFGKLSPPTKRKVIVLTAAEIVKFFNSDGSPVNECKTPVVMKKPALRLFRYNSIDEDGMLRRAIWPKCLKSDFHDIYYNVGNAELIEKQCNRTRYQVGGSETASTCSVNQRDMSLFKTISSDCASSRTNQLSHTKEEARNNKQITMEFNNSKLESRDSSLKEVSLTIRRPLENSSEAVQCRKRNGMEIPPTQQPSKKPLLSRSVSDCSVKVREPRSMRNRKKMEEVIKETLLANEIDVDSSLFEPCFKRLCTVTETFVKDLPTSRGLREEMQKIANQYAAHTIDFERNYQQRISMGIKR